MQIGSGFNVNEIVSSLVQAERQPVQARINSTMQTLNSQISSIGKIKSGISEFLSNLEKIKQGDDLKGIEIKSQTEGFQPRVNSQYSGVSGNFQFEVKSQANRDSFMTQTSVFSNQSLGSGNITITNNKGVSEEIAISALDKLADVATRINQASGSTGVQASIINVSNQNGISEQRLIIQSRENGQENGFTISADSPDLSFLTTSQMRQTSTASDAQIEMDGLLINSSSGNFDDVVSGIDFSTVGLSVGSMVNFEISSSRPPIKNAAQAFVTAYNSIQGMINSDDKNLDTMTANQIRRELRAMLNQQVQMSDGSSQSLANAGIMTNAKTGDLEINDEQFNRFLNENPRGLEELLAGSDGVINTLESKLKPMVEFNGMLDLRKTTIESQQRRTGFDQEQLDRRIQQYEQRVSSQFLQLEKVLNSLNSQNNSLITFFN